MKNFLKTLFGSPAKEDNNHVSSFNEQHAQEEDVEFIDHGVQTISLENIIGSVGKYSDFDSRFRPKKHVSGKRFMDIKRCMREGTSLDRKSVV